MVTLKSDPFWYRIKSGAVDKEVQKSPNLLPKIKILYSFSDSNIDVYTAAVNIKG